MIMVVYFLSSPFWIRDVHDFMWFWCIWIYMSWHFGILYSTLSSFMAVYVIVFYNIKDNVMFKLGVIYISCTCASCLLVLGFISCIHSVLYHYEHDRSICILWVFCDIGVSHVHLESFHRISVVWHLIFFFQIP